MSAGVGEPLRGMGGGGRWTRSPGQPLLSRTHAPSPGGCTLLSPREFQGNQIKWVPTSSAPARLISPNSGNSRRDSWIKFCGDEPPRAPDDAGLLHRIVAPPRVPSVAGWSCASTVWCRASDLRANLGLLHGRGGRGACACVRARAGAGGCAGAFATVSQARNSVRGTSDLGTSWTP